MSRLIHKKRKLALSAIVIGKNTRLHSKPIYKMSKMKTVPQWMHDFWFVAHYMYPLGFTMKPKFYDVLHIAPPLLPCKRCRDHFDILMHHTPEPRLGEDLGLYCFHIHNAVNKKAEHKLYSQYQFELEYDARYSGYEKDEFTLRYNRLVKVMKERIEKQSELVPIEKNRLLVALKQFEFYVQENRKLINK